MNKALIKIKKLFSGSAVRSVATLASGSSAAQLLVLLSSPLLARLYTPEHFSILAVFVAVLKITVVVSSFRYHLAIPIAKNDGDAVSVVFLCMLLTSCVSVLVGLGARSLFYNELTSLPTYSRDLFVYALPLGILFTGFLQTVRFWAVRTKNFKNMARARINQALVSTAFQISFFSYGAVALVVGLVTGRFSAGYRMTVAFWREGDRSEVSIRKIVNLAVKFKRFPLHSTY